MSSLLTNYSARQVFGRSFLETAQWLRFRQMFLVLCRQSSQDFLGIPF